MRNQMDSVTPTMTPMAIHHKNGQWSDSDSATMITPQTIVIHSMTLSGDPPMPLLMTKLSNQRIGEVLNTRASHGDIPKVYDRRRSRSAASACNTFRPEASSL